MMEKSGRQGRAIMPKRIIIAFSTLSLYIQTTLLLLYEKNHYIIAHADGNAYGIGAKQ